MNLFNRKSSTPTSPSIYEGGRDIADRAAATGRDIAERASETGREIAARASASGQALAGRATEFYRRNPKTVHAAALVGAVALLGLVKNRGLRRT